MFIKIKDTIINTEYLQGVSVIPAEERRDPIISFMMSHNIQELQIELPESSLKGAMEKIDVLLNPETIA